FFFQAEDGIRDKLVTGVQTCALPISYSCRSPSGSSTTTGAGTGCSPSYWCSSRSGFLASHSTAATNRRSRRSMISEEGGKNEHRSEERRVGKECRAQKARER